MNNIRLGFTALKTILESPSQFFQEFICGNRSESTPAMTLGTAVHLMILEPQRFADLVQVCGNRSKADKKTREESPDKIWITQAQHDTLKYIAKSVYNDELVNKILNTSNPIIEKRYYQKLEEDITLSSKADFATYDGRLVLEVKTIGDIKKIEYNSYQYKYNLQQALYRDILRSNGMSAVLYLTYFIETSKPYRTEIRQMDENTEELGRRAYKLAIERFKQCKKNNSWLVKQDKIETTRFSEWQYKTMENELNQIEEELNGQQD